MPALEPAPGPARRRRSGGPRRRRAGAGDRRDGPPPRPRRCLRHRGRRSVDDRRRARDRRTRASASSGAWLPLDGRRPPHRVVAADRASGPRPGLRRERPGQALAPRRRRRPPRSPRRPTPTSWPAGSDERVHRHACRRSAGRTSRSRATTSSSSAAAGTACRPPTTSRPATGSRTSPSSRPTTSRRATPAGTRRSSAPTTASPRRSASTSTRSRCTRPSRTRPAPRSSTRPRASSGWPTPRWRCAPSVRAPDEHGLRREDRHGQPGRAQGARPAGRPDRRRPLPGRWAPRITSRRRPPDTTASPGPSRPARRSAASMSSSTRR